MWLHHSIHDLLDHLRRCHPREIDMSLTRMTQLLKKIDHPEKKLPPVIHVAGTNGKGSTIAFMASILKRGGYRVHTYTSPHLVHFHERIRLHGEMIGDELAKEYLNYILRVNEDEPLTVFEGITAAAFMAFAAEPADVLLLETGLGGRLDATNVIDQPLLSVITPISYDHQEFLGHTLEEIAGEKAGIIKADRPVIIGSQPDPVIQVLRSKAEELHAPVDLVADHMDITSMVKDTPLGLKGGYQRENAALACLAINKVKEKLPIRNIDATLGLAEASWPGRWQAIDQGPLVRYLSPHSQLWVDGAHNEGGIQSIIPSLGAWKREGRPVVVGMNALANRPCQTFIELLQPYVDQWFFIDMEGDHRFHGAEDFSIKFNQITNLENLAKNLSYWSNGSRILITGSLYLVGDVLKINQSPLNIDLESMG
jgi:dihydrofolate synthase / folylpolyglutamate synthase